MTKGVVVGIEMVPVHGQHRHRHPVADGRPRGEVECGHHGATIRDSGQRIGVGEMPELGVGR